MQYLNYSIYILYLMSQIGQDRKIETDTLVPTQPKQNTKILSSTSPKFEIRNSKFKVQNLTFKTFQLHISSYSQVSGSGFLTRIIFSIASLALGSG